MPSAERRPAVSESRAAPDRIARSSVARHAQWFLLAAVLGCDSATQPPPDGTNDFAATSAGNIEGVVTRLNGAAATNLFLTGQIHGSVVSSATTNGAGAFVLRIVNPPGQPDSASYTLTVVVNATTVVGPVRDSLVLRTPVAVVMTRNITTPAVTTVVLGAAY